MHVLVGFVKGKTSSNNHFNNNLCSVWSHFHMSTFFLGYM